MMKRTICLRRDLVSPIQLFAFLVVVAALAFGQGGNGSITGTITDPARAVVAAATVEAKNTETGVVRSVASTNAGDYTISDLPVGTYVVTVAVQGFKTYIHPNLALTATQTLREDIMLHVGTAADSVTVSEEASLLKTETGEMTHNVTLEQMDDLPLLGIGLAGNGPTAIRNPFNVVLSLPGSSAYTLPGYNLGNFNGQTTQASIRIEGQDATPHALAYASMAQPGVDAIQEVAFQTSNYAPEFGTTGSVLLNFTMKSGTNQVSRQRLRLLRQRRPECRQSIHR